jgi:ferric-dicitrate binding protein FerR (iron transport regulator)
MSVSEALSRSFGEAAPPTATEAEAPTDNASAAPSGRKTAPLLLATLLTLGVAAPLVYTQWWVPREQAQQQIAQLKHELCLEEVKVYLGKPSHAGRLAQCTELLNG